MELELSLKNKNLDDESLQALTRELCETIRMETDGDACLPESVAGTNKRLRFLF